MIAQSSSEHAVSDTVATASMSAQTGTTPSTTPSRIHTFAISTEARDLEGRPLENDVTHEFSLARLVVQRLELLEPLSTWRGNVDTGGTVGSFIGAGESSSTGLASIGFATFDISALPNLGEMLEFLSADFTSSIRGVREDPFGLWGDMTWDHTTFASSSQVWAAASLADLGVFIPAIPSPMARDAVVHDVTSEVIDDLAVRVIRANRSQYRFHITDIPDGTANAPLAHVYNDSVNTFLTAQYLLE